MVRSQTALQCVTAAQQLRHVGLPHVCGSLLVGVGVSPLSEPWRVLRLESLQVVPRVCCHDFRLVFRVPRRAAVAVVCRRCVC